MLILCKLCFSELAGIRRRRKKMLLQHLLYILLLLFYRSRLVTAAIEPKILLPFHGDYQVNYTIDAEEGCYKWKSLRQEVATITPIASTYNDADDCSRSAVIVVVSTQPLRKTTLLLATNVKTGTVYQSDVIVDRIHVIDVVSRTRELYLADPPEELRIRALDQDGNTFSSTAGMEFDWSLAQDEVSDKENHHPPVSAHSILHIQKFLDTIYVAQQYVDALENNAKMSDTILISGIQTGAAVVVAKLVSTIECHKSVKPSFVRFVVRDKVMLNPAHEIYLMRHSVIRYKVERWREGIPTEISMPNSQYVLNIRDVTEIKGPIVSLEPDTSTVLGRNIGHSQVYLVDQHLKHYDSSLMEQASSDIYVVEPAYLQFDIEPHGKWILEVGKTYEISIHIYNEDNKQILLDNNIRIEGTLDENHLEILERVQNGSWYLVKAVQRGSCVISSFLKGVVITALKAEKIGTNEKMMIYDNPIFTSQDMEIYDRIRVAPSLVLFPWQPELVIYKYNFKASGGSGNYTWSVNETDGSSISYTGEVTATCGKEENFLPRSIDVKATDIKNNYNYGNGRVILAQPVKMEFALSRLEAEIDTSMDLFVGMYARVNGKLVGFTDCSELHNFQWSIHDTSVFTFSGEAQSPFGKFLQTQPNTPYCLLRGVVALKEGHTTVSLSYHNQGETLQASTVIAAYKPLKVRDPKKLSVLALGSAKTMVFEGGPNPWPLVPNNHEKTIKGTGGLVNFAHKFSGKEHVYIGSCTGLGKSEVIFSVGNKPCSTNPFPERRKLTVEVSCAVPTSLKLSTDYLSSDCPLSQNQNTHTVVLAGDVIKVTISAYDKFGNQFDNFTSLSRTWRVDSGSGSVNLNQATDSFNPDSFSQLKHSVTHDIIAHHKLGGANWRLVCDGYNKFVSRDLCAPYSCRISPAVESSIFVDVVAPVTISPQTVVMFNRPTYSANVLISGGSGYFNHNAVSDRDAANTIGISFNDSTDRSIVISPLSSGHATVSVSDQCIPKATKVPESKPTTTVTVSDFSSLVLKAPNLVEVGSLDKVSIQLDLKQLLISDSLDIDINVTEDPPGIISLDQAVKGDDSIFYANIKALKVGSVMIKATTTSRDGKPISSNVAKVTVFPPLLLKPPRITVIRGSEFHLYVEGGPLEDVQTVFDVEDTSIASSSVGDALIAHEFGNTTVKVRAITKDGQVFHGKSKSLVHVVKIKGVLIDIPTHRFYTGASVPVYVYGYAGPGYDPVSLDSAAAGLIFQWQVNNHAVLKLHSIHHSSGIEVSEGLKFMMLLEGKSAGRGLISVVVSASRKNYGQLTSAQLQAEMQVNVFDSLFVLSDEGKVWGSRNNLLLTPETSFQLISNRDHVAAKVDRIALCETCTFNISASQGDSCVLVNDEVKTVTTGNTPCFGTLLVTAHERFGVSQSLAIRVTVKMVSYLLPESKDKFYHKTPDALLSGFPLGSKVSMKISQFDNFGQRFDVAKPNANVRVNRNDVVEVTADPSTSVVKIMAAHIGVTVFRLWNDKNTVHYFPYPVISTMEHEIDGIHVPVGIKRCIVSNMVSAGGSIGKISVTRPFSVMIEQAAILPISATVAKLSYSVEGVQAKMSLASTAFSIKLDKNHIPREINNVQSSYIIPIEILDYSHDSCPGLEREMNNFAEESFNCTGFLVNAIEPLKVFEVRTAYVSNINSYACVVDALSLPPKVIEKVSVFEDVSFTLVLSVNRKNSERGISLQSPVNMRFLPAFKVLNDSEVVMVDGKGMLCVSAILEIHSSIEVITDGRNFEVHQPGPSEDGVVCREFSLGMDSSLMTKHIVKFISKLTRQEEVVSVTFRCFQRQSPQAVPGHPSLLEPALRSDPWLAYQFYSYSYYTMMLVTALILLMSTLLFCGLLRWTNSPTPAQVQSPTSPFLSQSRRSPGMAPYSPSNSYLFPRISPNQQRKTGSPSSQSPGSPSPRRPQLWSTFYQPQGTGT